MKYKVLIICFFIFFSSVTIFAKETRTVIGEWKAYTGGKIQFWVTDKNGNKEAAIYIRDEHIIETNYFSVSKADLEKIKALIEETIQELEIDSNK